MNESTPNPDLANATVDLGGVDTQVAGEFPPVPAGDYLVRIGEATLGYTGPTSKSPGAPMYTLVGEVQQGEFTGRKFWFRRPVLVASASSKGTLGFVKGDLAGLGLSVPGAMSAANLAKYVVREAQGRLVAFRIGFGRGEYKERNEVKAVLPADTIDDSAAGAAVVVGDDVPF